MVDKAKKYIKVGDIFQVVLSQDLKLNCLKNHWKFIKSSELLTLLPLCIFLILMIFKL